jgi:hypothetical protein
VNPTEVLVDRARLMLLAALAILVGVLWSLAARVDAGPQPLPTAPVATPVPEVTALPDVVVIGWTR